MPAIETKGLTKRFGELTAVRELNLTVREGELFSLLGVNGAGKTTTIKMLATLLKPTQGDARIFGKSLSDGEAAIKPLLAVSPQDTAVAPNLTVRENLELMAGLYGSGRKEAKRRAQEMLEEFGMEQTAAKRAKTLSGGWQRRLSIAMALISRPKLLFLDEPTLGLDVLARRELWEVIGGLKGKITIILTTHYMEEAERLSDRIGIMANGSLRTVGTVRELLRQAGTENFEDAFVRLAGGEQK